MHSWSSLFPSSFVSFFPVSLLPTFYPSFVLVSCSVYFDQTSILQSLDLSQSVVPELKKVCKQIGVLLRVLYSFLRMLPVHRLVSRWQQSAQGLAGSNLHFSLYCPSDDSNRNGQQSIAGSISSLQSIDSVIGLMNSNTEGLEFGVEVPCGHYATPAVRTPFGQVLNQGLPPLPSHHRHHYRHQRAFSNLRIVWQCSWSCRPRTVATSPFN
jgi:hypothetical protein